MSRQVTEYIDIVLVYPCHTQAVERVFRLVTNALHRFVINLLEMDLYEPELCMLLFCLYFNEKI